MVYAFDDYIGYEVKFKDNSVGKIVLDSGIRPTQCWASPVKYFTVAMSDGSRKKVRTDELEIPGFFQRTLDSLLERKRLISQNGDGLLEKDLYYSG